MKTAGSLIHIMWQSIQTFLEQNVINASSTDAAFAQIVKIVYPK